MTERKYNRILWCDLTPNGWSVCFETPNGALFNRLYIGYSKPRPCGGHGRNGPGTTTL